MKIKVLGSGCTKCHKLEGNAKMAVKELDMDALVEMVTDLNMIADYGVMKTPALVVDEEVKSMGKVLSVNDVKNILSL